MYNMCILLFFGSFAYKGLPIVLYVILSDVCRIVLY